MIKPTIGFIGLGIMGGAMVSRLQDLGYSLTVLGNRDRSNLDLAIARGATEAVTAKDDANDNGQDDEMVSQMVDYFVRRFKV